MIRSYHPTSIHPLDRRFVLRGLAGFVGLAAVVFLLTQDKGSYDMRVNDCIEKKEEIYRDSKGIRPNQELEPRTYSNIQRLCKYENRNL